MTQLQQKKKKQQRKNRLIFRYVSDRWLSKDVVALKKKKKVK